MTMTGCILDSQLCGLDNCAYVTLSDTALLLILCLYQVPVCRKTVSFSKESWKVTTPKMPRNTKVPLSVVCRFWMSALCDITRGTEVSCGQRSLAAKCSRMQGFPCLLSDTGPSVCPLQHRQVHSGFASQHRRFAARLGVWRVGPSQSPDLRPHQQPECRHRGGVCDQR